MHTECTRRARLSERVKLVLLCIQDFSAFVTATKYKTDAERFGWSFVFEPLLAPEVCPPTLLYSLSNDNLPALCMFHSELELYPSTQTVLRRNSAINRQSPRGNRIARALPTIEIHDSEELFGSCWEFSENCVSATTTH